MSDVDPKDLDYLSSVAAVQRDHAGMFVGASWKRAGRLVDAGLLAHAWLDDDEHGTTKRAVILTDAGASLLVAEGYIDDDEHIETAEEFRFPQESTDAD